MSASLFALTITLVALIGSLVKAPTFSHESTHMQHTIPLDSLTYTVVAGDNLIITLPDSLADQAVAAYHLSQPPALSWLHDRSFVWKTRDRDRGEHRLLFEATVSSIAPDSFIVRVTVE